MWNKTIARLRIYLQYFPFTVNAFLLAAGILLAFRWMSPGAQPQRQETSSFAPLIQLMGKTALYFIAALLLLSLLSTVTCWLLYLLKKRSKQHQIDFNFRHQPERKAFWLESVLKKVRRPLLGFVKARLIYDDGQLTDKFVLASNKRNSRKFWREAITGNNRIDLPDIKEYKVSGGFVYFEDMLQLFSLPVRQQVQGHFFQPPARTYLEDKEVQPKKTEQTDVRIEQLRKVEGELLNYKDFEHGDDVRRIVWKLYARNRELIVRVPETLEPYASHLYFYASFFCGYRLPSLQNLFVREMLNYYKNNVWSAFDALSKKEWATRFIPDQAIKLVQEDDDAQATVQRIISNATWQTDNDLRAYFRPATAAVLCISSYNNPDDLSEILSQCSADTVVYFVQLSRCFRHPVAGGWFLRLFLLPPNDRLKRIRGKWLFSSLRRQLLANESKLITVLNQHDVTVGWL